MSGTTVCHAHGGRAPQTRRAADRRLAESEARAVVLAHDLEPVTDPFTALATLASEVVALKEALREMVVDLGTITGSARDGRLEIRPEVTAYERALERASRILTDMARLGLEEQVVRLSTAQGEMIVEVISRALVELGMSPDDQAVRLAVAAQLRAPANSIAVSAVDG